MSEKSFYSLGQRVLNDFRPLIYNPYGVVDAQIDALKIKMLDFPNQMRAGEEARQRRKEASAELDRVNKAIALLLKTRIDMLIEMAKPSFDKECAYYREFRYFGLIRPISGKPPHKGTIAQNQIKLIDKHPYRRKRAMFVKNTGQSALMAGLGTTEAGFSGTPFIIPPGKTKRRITQKLAPAGEFFLLQNMGEGDGGYEVWIKE